MARYLQPQHPRFLFTACLALAGLAQAPVRAQSEVEPALVKLPAPAAAVAVEAAAVAAAGAAPVTNTAPIVAAAALGPRLQLHWASVRANAVVVQNRIGNAYALQAGWAPQLRLRDLPIGLRLLAEFGALRSQDKKVFVAPSTQLLATWQMGHHVELAVGAGVQFWCVPQQLVRPVATLEAHYLPHHKVLRVVRSAFVASSLGASSGAGLQVRAGLSFDFHRAPQGAGPAVSVGSYLAHPNAAVQQLVAPSPACPACQNCADAEAAPDLPEDVLLASHLVFAFNAAELSDAATAYLRELGAALAAAPHAWDKIEVVGHADSIGTEAQTQLVSVHRAEAVLGALREAGVPAERIEARGVGKRAPIVGVEPKQAQQRRVTLRLHHLQGSPRLRAFIHVPPHDFEERSP